MMGRFRSLLPPASALVAFAASMILAELPMLAFVRRPFWVPPPELLYPALMVHVLAALAYGAYRCAGFHPFYRASYRAWLETTPWTWRLPLPAGPVRLVWEDAVIVSAGGLPVWLHGGISPLATMSLVLGSYLFLLSFTFGATGAWGFGYLVQVAVALALRLREVSPIDYSGAILVGYLVGMIGLSRSLRSWPWSGLPVPDLQKLAQTGTPATPENALGWPFDRLGPRVEPPRPGRKPIDPLLTSLVIGWWIYAGQYLIPTPQNRWIVLRMLLGYGSFGGALARLGIFTTGYSSPISLVARIVRLRPLVPSYDQVFAAPLVAFLTGTVGPPILDRLGVPTDFVVPIAASLVLIALTMGGPDRKRWQLTARHRAVPAVNARGGFVQVG